MFIAAAAAIVGDVFAAVDETELELLEVLNKGIIYGPGKLTFLILAVPS
jgi:hypothetical protein